MWVVQSFTRFWSLKGTVLLLHNNEKLFISDFFLHFFIQYIHMILSVFWMHMILMIQILFSTIFVDCWDGKKTILVSALFRFCLLCFFDDLRYDINHWMLLHMHSFLHCGKLLNWQYWMWCVLFYGYDIDWYRLLILTLRTNCLMTRF